ncbi:MAG: V-type ATP synthase subunit A [Methanomicrobiaceae archaeon]|nr:V-type ATP synthase subunit A [Methanomicrobiaceae archaeon]
MIEEGMIIRVAGPVVSAKNMRGSRMYELVRVGAEQLIGEIIELEEDVATIQVYEETAGLTPGEPVRGTGLSLFVELAPGLLGKIYDGVQRPLQRLSEKTGEYIKRGVAVPSLEREKRWHFVPQASSGDELVPGDVLGTVAETRFITHRIMVPPGTRGILEMIVPEGKYLITDEIARLREGSEEHLIAMLQRWPVRKSRPFRERLEPEKPLISGQRVIDTFFPIAKGGTAAIPGPFGSGKTVVQQQLAKWVDADIIVYVGCGERGNEMADVLRELPALEDPRTGEALLKRTVLIANTSNMPVAAREASVYTGITIAEYYRDMGYDVALMADSTSRWAEAMREISGRLEEMPGEEGYPAYLASRLAAFYERAGRVVADGKEGRMGSISVIGAVSPPGGDFSEPVTQNTLRIVKVFWALDADLANKRHFPAINWLESYSLYTGNVQEWWDAVLGEPWGPVRMEMMAILQKESELEEIVQLVGQDVLPEQDKLVLLEADMIKESFLVQNAFHPFDTFCSPHKQVRMLDLLHRFFGRARTAVAGGTPASAIRGTEVHAGLSRFWSVPEEDVDQRYHELVAAMEKQSEGGI